MTVSMRATSIAGGSKDRANFVALMSSCLCCGDLLERGALDGGVMTSMGETGPQLMRAILAEGVERLKDHGLLATSAAGDGRRGKEIGGWPKR